jgi:hypothetical protein
MGRYDVLLENNQPPKPQPVSSGAEKAKPKAFEPLKSPRPATQPFEAAPTVEPALELAGPRVHKDTVRISDSEYEAFDELKRDARRRFDLIQVLTYRHASMPVDMVGETGAIVGEVDPDCLGIEHKKNG